VLGQQIARALVGGHRPERGRQLVPDRIGHRQLEVLAAGADQRMLANADVRPALERLTTTYGGERGSRAFAAVDRALFALQRNASVKLVADWLVLQL